MTAKKFRPVGFPLTTYRRNNAPALLCAIRRILVVKTPEEEIRQKFLLFLMRDLQTPQGMLEAEESMTHYHSRVRGRADIVGFSADPKTPREKEALFVVECKAPSVGLTDDVREQAEKYAGKLKVEILILTNGDETEFYLWNSAKKKWKVAKRPLSYKEMLNLDGGDYLAAPLPPWRRHSFGKLNSPQTIHQLQKWGHIGLDTPRKLHPFLANLTGLFHDETSSPRLPQIRGKIKLAESGIRYTGFGNAGGGKWDGDYRYFVLRDTKGENQIICFRVFGNQQTKKENDKHWGNRRGSTSLIVAIDERKGNSLQLRLDKFADFLNSKARIWHDGTLTVGRKGAAKRKDVIKFIARRAPHLCKNGVVELGVLPTNRLVEWKDVRNFIFNLIEYALLRDKFRDYAKRRLR